MREVFAIDGERRVAPLIIDIEIDDIGGDFLFAESSSDFADAGFRAIAVAALLVAKGPQRRQRCAANQCSKFLHDLFGLRAGEKIIVKLAAFRAKRKIVRRLFAKVETGAPGVVEKNAPGAAF